jgi:hypothetical protein
MIHATPLVVSIEASLVVTALAKMKTKLFDMSQVNFC